MTRAIRLYSSTGGVELVPPVAAEFGLKVMVGAWIDKNADRNEREIDAAITLARRNSNVIGVVVGNEVIYRGEQKVDDLIEMIKRVKKSVSVPVTTGEIWHVWREFPQACQQRRFHRRARAALLGKLHRQAGGGSGGRSLQPAARHLPRQARRDRRIRLAERRLQSARTPFPASSSRPPCCATSSPAPKPSAWTTTSSRRSISPGSSSKAASAPIGASSTPSASRSSRGPARS